MHGYIERLTEEYWDEQYVLTNEQYADDILRDSGWIETFRNDVQYADSIFFFGYAAGDIDIARLLYENPSLRIKTYFFIGESAPRSVEIRVRAFGTSFKFDTSTVAAMIPSPDDPSIPKPSPFLSALSKVDLQPATAAPSRAEVVDLLVKGDVQPKFIARDLINGTEEYYVSRDNINKLSAHIEKIPARWLIHANLGEGKTLSLIELTHFLLAENFTILMLDGDLEGFSNDIDYLRSLDTQTQSKICIIVENSFSFVTEIRSLVERFPLCSFIITCRSAALQTRVGNISETFGDEFQQIELNELSDDEINEFDEILFRNGLWGDRQGLEKNKRISLIKDKYRRNLSSILVDVCRSTDIFKRISDSFHNLGPHVSDLRKSIIVALALAYSGARAGISQVCEIVQADIFKYGSAQSDPVVQEFFDIENNRLLVRSPAFAKAILKEAVDDSILIDLLPQVVSRLSRLRDDNKSYEEPQKQMMRFGFIEQILSNNDEKEAKLVAYFEAIRASGVGAANPQFWLQYAIACMSFKDYKQADDHFNTAFDLAKNKGGYDPYQIENQYAKFLLESRIHTDYWEDFFDSLAKAHEIIHRQMSSFKEGYYPYRVARLYLEFVDIRLNSMDKEQRKRALEWCAQLQVLADKAPPVVRRSVYWRDAKEALRAASDIIRDTTR